MDEHTIIVGELKRLIRQERNSKRLAQVIGMSDKSSISKRVGGDQDFRLKEACLLAEALGTSLGEILGVATSNSDLKDRIKALEREVDILKARLDAEQAHVQNLLDRIAGPPSERPVQKRNAS